jgi:Fe-S-cluster-containing dehydrogenase component
MKERFGLLIDYEHCTGCMSCIVACNEENGWPDDLSGMKVMEILEDLPKKKMYLVYRPFPTELCVLCPKRKKRGLPPACVSHCMAGCITYGPISELAEQMKKKKRTVLWAPR